MTISASRRTDIPAFYPEWLKNTSRDMDMRIKLDINRLHWRMDSKLDLLMGKVPKELKG